MYVVLEDHYYYILWNSFIIFIFISISNGISILVLNGTFILKGMNYCIFLIVVLSFGLLYF